MKEYGECKEIALEYAKYIEVEINEAGETTTAYVFDNSELEMAGYLPFAVLKSNGEIMNLWTYLNATKTSMDAIKDIEF